ncbi:MAG: tryptophan synthase subunit alpha [bacterium]|nr:tryptophan synthase subunit alpha [bacterium]
MSGAGDGRLEAALRAARHRGRKCLVPYITGGLPGWQAAVEAAAAAGADAVEIGIPFSDPVMDGPVIQEAGDRALAAGATPAGLLAAAAGLDVGVPLVVMTYYNIAHHMGHERFASSLASSGISGAILADLPLEESAPWTAAADAAGVETVLLAAPTASDARLEAVCERARGFVYAVGLLGVTGERAALAASALVIARRLKAVTDLPVLVGVGVSTPAGAAEATTVADGVVVGSAVVRRLLEGEGPEGVGAFVAGLRSALDRGQPVGTSAGGPAGAASDRSVRYR